MYCYLGKEKKGTANAGTLRQEPTWCLWWKVTKPLQYNRMSMMRVGGDDVREDNGKTRKGTDHVGWSFYFF